MQDFHAKALLVRKAPQFVIAYWLLPAEPAGDFFRQTIQRFAALYDAPIFEPHLTLAVGADSGPEIGCVLDRIRSGPLQLRVEGIAFSNRFTRTLFVRLAADLPLRHLRDSLGLVLDEPFDPHLSLLYHHLTPAEQARLALSIHLPFATVRFDRVAAIQCQVPVATSDDVRSWKFIAGRPLEPGT